MRPIVLTALVGLAVVGTSYQIGWLIVLSLFGLIFCWIFLGQ